MVKKRFIKIWLLLKAYKYALSFVIGVSCLALTIFLIVLPKLEVYNAKTQEEMMLKKKLEMLENFAAKHQEFESFLQDRQEVYDKLVKMLPNSQAKEQYIEGINKIVQKTGGILNSTNIKRSNAMDLSDKKVILKQLKNSQERLATYDINIKYVGNYTQILKFLEQMDSNYAMGLGELRITSYKEEKLLLEGCISCYVNR